MTAKMTEPRIRMLKRLAEVPEDMLFKCGGNQRIACGGLVDLGYAMLITNNIDEGFMSAYTITYQGQCWLDAHGFPSKLRD